MFAYIHFGINGDRSEMEDWLEKVLALKRAGTYDDWWNHSDQTRLRNELAKIDGDLEGDEDYQPANDYFDPSSHKDSFSGKSS